MSQNLNIYTDAWIRELCGVKKGLNERIDEGMLQWFGHVERLERDRIAKRVYVWKCAGSCSLGRPWKRLIYTVKGCLKKGGLDIRQDRRMVQDRSEWQGFVRGNAWGIAGGMNPWTWQDATAIWSPWSVEVHLWLSLQLKGHKGENLLFFFSFLFYWGSFHGMMCASPAVAGGGDCLINKYILHILKNKLINIIQIT